VTEATRSPTLRRSSLRLRQNRASATTTPISPPWNDMPSSRGTQPSQSAIRSSGLCRKAAGRLLQAGPSTSCRRKCCRKVVAQPPATMTPSVIQTNRSPMSSAVAGALPLKGGFFHRLAWRSILTISHQPSSRPVI